MNLILRLTNVILAVVVAFFLQLWIRELVSEQSKRADENKSSAMVTEEVSPAIKQIQTASVQTEPGIPVRTMIDAIKSNNIFNPERVPSSTVKGVAANTQITANMSLVGTYSIGDTLGAIIIQKLQGNSQQKLKELQQKQYEELQANSPRSAKMNENDKEGDNTDSSEKSDTNEKPEKKMVASITANNIMRQFLKVGDTTVNGYTLTEVTRSSATLQKNREIITLTLLSPTESQAVQNVKPKNNNSKNNNNNKNNNKNNNNKKK